MRETVSIVTGAVVLVSIAFLEGCGDGGAKTPSGPTVLKGAGATAPSLVYAKWAEAYNASNQGVKVEYEPTGSGEGIRRIEAGTVDFAASDIPLDDAEMAKVKTKLLHFPALVSAIVPVYNLSGVSNLQFTGETLAGIFAGKITYWSDPALVKTNPGVVLPGARIFVVHRSDQSGSTFALTDYLSKVSESWNKEMGRGATVKFPAGGEVTSNEAMAELVKKTPNSIGYADLDYAEAHRLSVGAVMNAAGKFQKATLESMGGALELADSMQKDYRGSIANAPGQKAYPICTLTWLIVPGEYADANKGKAMKRFLRWAFEDGQKIAMPMDYGILQPPLLDRVKDQIERIRTTN